MHFPESIANDARWGRLLRSSRFLLFEVMLLRMLCGGDEKFHFEMINLYLKQRKLVIVIYLVSDHNCTVYLYVCMFTWF